MFTPYLYLSHKNKLIMFTLSFYAAFTKPRDRNTVLDSCRGELYLLAAEAFKIGICFVSEIEPLKISDL